MEGSERYRASLAALVVTSAAAIGCPPSSPAEGPVLVTPPADLSEAGPALPSTSVDDARPGASDASAAASEGGTLVPSSGADPQSAAPLPDDASAMLAPLGASWKPPPLRRTAGRCWERYADLPAAALASARKEFQARNPGWRVTTGGIDATFGTVRLADLTGPAAAGRASTSSGIQRYAVVFARRNADLPGARRAGFRGPGLEG